MRGFGELVDGDASSLSLLSRAPADTDHAASVHRDGSRPEINYRQTFTQEFLLIRELQYLSQIQFFHRELQPAR
jgi:hypothetical protein